MCVPIALAIPNGNWHIFCLGLCSHSMAFFTGKQNTALTFTTRKRNIVWVNGKIRSRINGFQETTRHKYQVLGLLWAHQTRVSNNESVSLVSKESLQALRAYLHTITWYLIFTFNSKSILTTFDGL